MTDIDRETQAAIDALVYRLKNRTDEDDEPFALEFMMAMRLRGWRPTEARAPWDFRQTPAGEGVPTSEDALGAVEAARERLREIAARLAPGGDAA